MTLAPEAPTFRSFGRATPALLDGDYVVKGCIDEGALALIYGARNCGKTFLALDLALSVATGLSWNGHPVRDGFVAYVAAESGYRIQRRVRASARYPLRRIRRPVAGHRTARGQPHARRRNRGVRRLRHRARGRT